MEHLTGSPVAALTPPVQQGGADTSPPNGRISEVGQKGLSNPPSPVSKAFDMTPKMQAVVLDLEGKLADAGQQSAFIKALTGLISRIAGLKEKIATQNRLFEMDFGRLSQADVRDRWRLIKERGIVKVGAEKAAAQTIQDIFSRRMKEVLQTAIQNAIIEKAILKEVIDGHKTTMSFSAWRRATSCYGTAFRLEEIKAALEARNGKLQIAPGEVAPNVELPKPPAAGSAGEKLIDLSKELSCLDEGASAIYEALRNVVNDIGGNNWPSKLYHQLMGGFLKNQEAINALKPELETRKQQIDEAIKTLEAEIKTPSDKDGDNAAIVALKQQKTKELTSLNQEKAEIATRWESIKTHENHLSTVLGYIKKLFSLADQVADDKQEQEVDVLQEHAVDDDDEEQVEDDESEDLSVVYSKAFTLLTLITSHRDVVLADAWEHFGEINQRKAVYFKDARKLEDLEAQRKSTVSDVAARVASLDKEILDNRGFIQALEFGMIKIAEQVKLLGVEAQVRDKWKVEAIQ